MALIAIGVAAFLLIRTERQIGERAAALRVFDRHAREASDALAEARVAQHGYVAAGQGEAFWMSKVTTASEMVHTALVALGQAATPAGRTAVGEATETAWEFGNIDKRVREYMTSGQQLMAADVIFTEGSDAAATAGRQMETARLAEHQAFDRDLVEMRRRQVITIAAAAGVCALVVLLLIPIRRAAIAAAALESSSSISIAPFPVGVPATPAPAETTSPTSGELFRAAADLATDFGRVRDLEELTRILSRAADLLDASGLMVWMGTSTGGDLRPVLAHGYSSQMIARIPPVARSANNAAAAAYRSGTLQIVLSRPGVSSGAVVAPILSSDGCIGAFSAEIRGSGETSELIQALATIFASHLAVVLAATPSEMVEPKAASLG
jgi:hypothetical protein